jgi:predicted RND superfamily exporter protein
MDLSEFIGSGRIVDLMIIFVVIEVVMLVVYWKRTGRGVPTVPLLANIGAGGSLMLALGATLNGMSATTIALCLIASLIFHMTDLAIRWQR